MKFGFALVVALLAPFASVPAAEASCAPPGTATLRLAAADGAFVGTFVSSRTDPDGRHFMTFEVERTYKGTLPSPLDVLSTHGPNTSVSLNPQPGERVALHVDRTGNDWEAIDCDRTSEEALQDAATGRCSLGRLPRRYRRPVPPHGARSLHYSALPRVVGCGRVPGGDAYKLVAFRLAMRPGARGSLCIVTWWPMDRSGFGCANRRVEGGGAIEAGVHGGDPFAAMGNVDPFVHAVRMHYRLEGSEHTRAASVRLLSSPRLLSRLRLRRPVAVYVAQLPPDAAPLRVEPLSWRGDPGPAAEF